MSYAIQGIQENILATGGYVSEVLAYDKLKCDPDFIFEAFLDLIHQGLLSKEYYQNKGHKVLGRLIAGTNAFEINPEVQNDPYEDCYLLEFAQIIVLEGEERPFLALSQIYVGDEIEAIKHAEKIKAMLEKDTRFQKTTYTMTKQTKTKN